MRRALQIVVTLALLAGLFWYVDLDEAVRHIEQLNWAFALPAVALLFVQNDLTTRRWATMLRAFTQSPGHLRMLRIQYMALFAQLFLPSSVGGAAVRTGMLYRSGTAFGIAVNSVVLDRIVAVGGLFLLAVAFMPAISVSVGESPRWLLVAGALPLALVVGALAYRPLYFWFSLLKRTPMKHFVEPLEQSASKIIEPRRLFAALALSLAGQFVAVAAIFMLSKGSGLNVRLLDCILVMPPVMLLAALPISIAGWGVREGAMIVAFGLLDVPREAALVLSLQFVFLGYVSAVPGAIAWLAEANRCAFKGSSRADG